MLNEQNDEPDLEDVMFDAYDLGENLGNDGKSDEANNQSLDQVSIKVGATQEVEVHLRVLHEALTKELRPPGCPCDVSRVVTSGGIKERSLRNISSKPYERPSKQKPCWALRSNQCPDRAKQGKGEF